MRFLLSLILVMFFVLPVSAQEPQRYTELRLVVDTDEIEAGDILTVAVEQVIAPGWHTYWKNPGDSGAEPRFNWSLPDGFSLGQMRWPTPEKIPYGPLMNFGYENRAVMSQDIFVPDDYDAGPVTIGVGVDILVCADVCIPEYEELSFTLNDPNIPVVEAEGSARYISDLTRDYPGQADFPSLYWEEDGVFYLDIEERTLVGASNVQFFPVEWGLVSNPEPQIVTMQDAGFQIAQTRGDRDLSEIEGFSYVISFERNGKRFSYEAYATPRDVAGSAVAGAPMEGGVATPLLLVLLGAFAGGLVLNLMPCVFPVLSIKALSLVKIADGHPKEARAHGLAYTAGVVLSFLAVAGVLMALKFGGAQIGWGFQLQSPIVVAILVYLLFVVALNLFGMFEVKSLGHVGGKAADEGGLKGAFFTGVLATIVATPCTAPFMATAIGVALTQSVAVGLLIFGVIGLGLAFPYLALSFIPALQRFLPKPGAWMRTFQQLLAFPMMVAVVWLLWVLSQQVISMQLFAVILGLVAMAFGIWAWQLRGVIAKAFSVLAFMFVVMSLFIAAPQPGPVQVEGGAKTFGQVFSSEALDEALASGDPVFVEMTAAWCITCKVNHAAALNVQVTRDLFDANNVVYLIGDWTNRDDVITQYLEGFGRNGVPLYVFYGAPDAGGVRPDPVLLPQLLTPGVVENYVLGTN